MGRHPYPFRSFWGQHSRHPLVVLVAGTALVFIALLVAVTASSAAFAQLYGLPLTTVLNPAAGPPAATDAYRWITASWQLLAWGGVSLWLGRLAGSTRHELGLRPTGTANLLLAGAATFLAMPLLQNLTIDADALYLPGLEEFQQWSVQKEAEAAALLERLLANRLAANLVVVALVPALAEELLFRGWLQRTLQRTMPVHAAIWVQGFVFSFIHFQILGFFVRWLLGAGFGYLRHWTGSLLPAMVGHFVNNAVSVVAAYYAFNGALPADIAAADYQAPWFPTLLAALVAGGLLYRLWENRIRNDAPLTDSPPPAHASL